MLWMLPLDAKLASQSIPGGVQGCPPIKGPWTRWAALYPARNATSQNVAICDPTKKGQRQSAGAYLRFNFNCDKSRTAPRSADVARAAYACSACDT